MNGWLNYKLEQVADILDSFRIPVSEEERDKNPGDIPYYGANGLQGFINGWIFDEPLILIAEDGGYFDEYTTRPIAYKIEGKSWVNNHAHILRPKEAFDFNFVFYSLQHKNITPFIKGGTRSKLNQKELREIEICAPKSNFLQQKIADILQTIDRAIEHTAALIEKYRQIKAGLMHDLFTRGIGADGKLRPPREQASHLYKETPIGWIPKEWDCEKLSYYLDASSGLKPGPFGSSLKKDSYVESGYKIYGQEQVISGSQNLGDYYISREKYSLLQDFSVSESDILISLVGTIGKVLVIRSPVEAGIINPRLMRIRLDPRKVKVEFLKNLLVSNLIVRQLDQFAGGGTMPVINAKIMRRLNIPAIKSEREQEAISNILDGVEREIVAESQLLDKLQKQKSGLMHDLLAGKVPVTISDEIQENAQTTRVAVNE